MFKMRITLVKNSGFCFGVKRALDKAMKAKGNVYTLGPLIHNPPVIKELERNGIKVVDSINAINEGTLIIRTHGVADSIIEKAKKKGLKILDLTCPFVKKTQDYAKKFYNKGYTLVVVGDKNHPEVKGIMGNVKNVLVIENEKEIDKINNHGKIGVVFQTTQSLDSAKSIIKKLENKCKEIEVAKTICSATLERQKAAKELAKEVDLMIVVGGYNSGNTKRLVGVCKEIVETRHIETEKELEKNWFKNKKHVGITAGASTPDWIINKIIKRIKNEF